MEHTNISTTLDAYTHMEEEALRKQIGELGGTAYHLSKQGMRRFGHYVDCLTRKQRGMAIRSLHHRVHRLHHILCHLQVAI